VVANGVGKLMEEKEGGRRGKGRREKEEGGGWKES
jgi:hypothetical protein